MVVDATDCPLRLPGDKNTKLDFCCIRTKDNGKSQVCWKYTVCVQIGNGRICAVWGPDKGKEADITCLRKYLPLVDLKDGECLLADKGYQGHEKCLTAFKNLASLRPTFEEEAFNEVLDSVRQIVECTFKRVKDFGILGSAGSFAYEKEKHSAVFNVCCQLTNIKLERDPLWNECNKLLF